MNKFKQELYELLTIQAPSKQEHKVRTYLEPQLVKLVDQIEVDSAGNLLASKKCGTGEGATVMLSAHMDSVSNIKTGRKVYEKDGVFYSTKGILGADDRAGIAIIMAILRNIDQYSFNGTLKIAFTVAEEIGCVGSTKMDVNWYKDVALAIVVDRKGNRDIVTGCGYPNTFCSDKVGKFFEDCSAMIGMDWKAVGGGISDAMTFSANGVHSVNLSAGYRHEHTEKEYVVIKDCFDTINLIIQALCLINGFAGTFGEVPQDDYYSYSSYGTKTTNSRFYDDELIWEQEGSSWGNVALSEIGGYISIYQKGNEKYKSEEIWMDRNNFDDMVNSYLLHKGLPTIQEMQQARIKLAIKNAEARGEKVLADAKQKVADLPTGIESNSKTGGKGTYIATRDGNLVKI